MISTGDYLPCLSLSGGDTHGRQAKDVACWDGRTLTDVRDEASKHPEGQCWCRCGMDGFFFCVPSELYAGTAAQHWLTAHRFLPWSPAQALRFFLRDDGLQQSAILNVVIHVLVDSLVLTMVVSRSRPVSALLTPPSPVRPVLSRYIHMQRASLLGLLLSVLCHRSARLHSSVPQGIATSSAIDEHKAHGDECLRQSISMDTRPCLGPSPGHTSSSRPVLEQSNACTPSQRRVLSTSTANESTAHNGPWNFLPTGRPACSDHW
jgi:hypothetical protein